MALFKILKGDSSRISTDITPFHDGYAYYTPDDAGFYIDAVYNGENVRKKINSVESSKSINATLSSSQWINGSQTLSIADIKIDTNGIIGLSHGATDDEMAACADAGIYVDSQGDGTLTLSITGSTPSIDIPVVVLIMG